MDEIRFDAIAALEARKSEEFGPWSASVEVPQSMIAAFAEMTGDRQWIHVDKERAAASPFGTTIAHGFLVLALSPVIKNSAGYVVVGHGSALNYGLERVRFVAPVPAGASVHGHTRIVDVAEEKGGTMLTTGVAIHVVGSDKPSVCFDWKILYRA
ncbi:MaoC family dehydratase [Parasphingopyxis marina]|uniref:MaoC family dehydratase n=1 Tax=Parasphingopyxis marina TaxID=2761622 RepID=A0A842I201_9SPHN|nr:MaoC family dehydratase [Parasphingopyxis marina]MBC2778967.1 MaoC family dehydratase [Parasphingopyxis marina]